MYHPQSDVGRLYIRRKKSGKGHLAINNCTEIEWKVS